MAQRKRFLKAYVEAARPEALQNASVSCTSMILAFLGENFGVPCQNAKIHQFRRMQLEKCCESWNCRVLYKRFLVVLPCAFVRLIAAVVTRLYIELAGVSACSHTPSPYFAGHPFELIARRLKRLAGRGASLPHDMLSRLSRCRTYTAISSFGLPKLVFVRGRNV